MPRTVSRSSDVHPDSELRLPRPPGVIRRFWARHPLVTDILIAGISLILSLSPAAAYRGTTDADGSGGSELTIGFLASGAVQWAVVLACAALLARRRFPLTTFGIAVVAQLAFFFTPFSAGAPLIVVAAYSVPVYRSTRAAWIAFGAAAGILTVTAIVLSATVPATAAAFWNVPFGGTVMMLLGVLVGVNVGNRKRYLEAVIDRSRQLLVERDQQAQLAAAAERARIAREMHDIVSHSLTVVVALAEGAAATEDPVRAREAMDAASATARTALAEMRATLGVLRTDDPAVPLVPAQPVSPHDTVAAAQRAGFPVALTVTGEEVAAPAVRYATGRIVQEGVTNAMRHAPRATQIRVRIDHSPTRVRIEVANDGARGSAAPSGFGLQGLAERAAHVGGTLHSGSVGGDRWLLHADLPVDVAAASRDASATASA